MRKMWRHIAFAILVPMLALGMAMSVGCSTQERAVALAGMALMSETRSADFTIESGEVMAAVNSIDLSEADRRRVDRAIARYQTSRENLVGIASNMRRMPDMLTAISAERQRLIRAYQGMAGVVEANWDRYEPEVQSNLSRWRREAYALNYSYEAFADIVKAPPDPLTQADVVGAMFDIVKTMAMRG